jgi:hypothetical protein
VTTGPALQRIGESKVESAVGDLLDLLLGVSAALRLLGFTFAGETR